MREILFRGRTYTGEWVEGTYYHMTEYYGSPYDKHFIITSHDDLEDNMMNFETVDPNTVGQYIGRNDKNGKKIFEGDILERKSVWGHDEHILIGYKGAAFIYSTPSDHRLDVGDVIDDNEWGIDVETREIVGNIHDNPELMEVQK